MDSAAEGQDRRESEFRLQSDRKKMEMRSPFLMGILCGVILAAVVIFTLTIPATNNRWRVEIVHRGGAAWYLDKKGDLRWMWIAQPIN